MSSEIDIAKAESAFVEAAIDPSRWSRAMDVIAAATGSFGAALFNSQTRLPDVPRSSEMGEAFDAYVRDGWIERDARYKLAPFLLRAGVTTDFDIFDQRQIARHPFYQEFLAPFKLQAFAGVKVTVGDSQWCLSLQRTIQQGPYSTDQLSTFRQLSTRLSTASNLSTMLGFARIEGALEAFQLSRTAAIILDGAGKVVTMNAKAEALLGLGIKVISRKIWSCDRDATANFEKALSAILRAQSSYSAGPIVFPRPEMPPIYVNLIRLKSVQYNPLEPGQVVVVLVNPEPANGPSQASLQNCFRLTPAEARLAQGIARGMSLERFAQETSISYQTVRNQLKAVFAKTDTHTQAQLTALLSQLLG